MIGPSVPLVSDAFLSQRLQELQAEATQERLLRSVEPSARPLPPVALPALVLKVLPAALCCPQAA